MVIQPQYVLHAFYRTQKLVVCILICSWDFQWPFCMLTDLSQTLPGLPEGPLHRFRHLWGLPHVIPRGPKGHCIGPANSRIQPSWDPSLATSTYSQQLSGSDLHFADIYWKMLKYKHCNDFLKALNSSSRIRDITKQHLSTQWTKSQAMK